MILSDARCRDDGACPYGALYWHFMIRNRPLLKRNNRVSQVYSNRDRMEETNRADYQASAEPILETLVPAKEGWRRYFDVTSMGWFSAAR